MIQAMKIAYGDPERGSGMFIHARRDMSRYYQRASGTLVQKASTRHWIAFTVLMVLATLVVGAEAFLSLPEVVGQSVGIVGYVAAGLVVPVDRKLKFDPSYINKWEVSAGLPQTDYSQFGCPPLPVIDETEKAINEIDKALKPKSQTPPWDLCACPACADKQRAALAVAELKAQAEPLTMTAAHLFDDAEAKLLAAHSIPSHAIGDSMRPDIGDLRGRTIICGRAQQIQPLDEPHPIALQPPPQCRVVHLEGDTGRGPVRMYLQPLSAGTFSRTDIEELLIPYDWQVVGWDSGMERIGTIGVTICPRNYDKYDDDFDDDFLTEY
jgi:hypothetical protein